MYQKFYCLTVACLFFVLLSSQKTRAQNAVDVKHIATLIENNSSAIRLSSVDRVNTRISDAYYNKQSGTLLVYLQQTYKGIDVYNAIKVLAFKNDKLVSVAGMRVSKMQLRVNNVEGVPYLRPENAVNAAAAHLNLTIAGALKPLNFTEGATEAEFSDLGISSQNIKVKLLWMPVENGQRVKLSWQVQIQPVKSPDHWLIRVDASDGSIINKDNLTVKCNWKTPIHQHTADCYEVKHYDNGDAGAAGAGLLKGPEVVNSAKYRVVPFPVEAPSFPGGTPTLVTNPWLLAPAGSPSGTLKWNDDGTTSYAITRGNNVYAYEDQNATHGTFGKSGNSSTPLPDLTFDYTFSPYGEPADSANLGLAITNLFYWNDIMHDLSYQYGFDEVAGNFQADNIGRGGVSGDYVLAEAQDGAGFDNANFATPPDGQNPRMQMYLFDYATDKICLANSPAAFFGYKPAIEGQLSAANTLAANGPITGNVVLYQDAVGNDSACDAAANQTALKGNIALIYRGNCNFTVKIKNAQIAGAIGVIMVDDNPNELIIMGGSDNTIVVPAVMITLADGNTIYNYLKTGTTVNMTLKIQYLDGDLDDGVISHEYTHGISNRLTGGPSNVTCLQNAEQMGEGWSDYDALMVTTDWANASLTDGPNKRPIGTYAIDQPPTGGGIRNYPYSTDMTVDPWTYDMLATKTGGEVHNIGEIWATVLWDMTWDIIQQDGLINKNIFDASAPGGNTVALRLMIEGLKLQPCSPGFIDGRDAILKADTLLYGGKYSCSIWKAFARRGMGIHASEGSSNNYTDQVADFTSAISASIVKSVDKDSAAQGEVLTYTIKALCQCAAVSNFRLVDTLPSAVTYISGGSYNSANRTVVFDGINLAASQSQDFQVQVKVNDGTYFAPGDVFADSVNNSSLPTATWTNQSTSGSTWKVVSTRNHTGSFSYFASDDTLATNKTLVTKNAYLLQGVSTLSFWHYYDVEDGYDGGVVEISPDSGTTWIDLGPYMTKNGYNGSIDPGNQTIISGRSAFTGSSNGVFLNTIADLSAFSGKRIMLRFRFASDAFVGVDGWYLDDITISDKAAVLNNGQLYNGHDTLQSFSKAITFIKDATLPVTWGDFTVTKQKNTALLNWKTLQELNTAKFVIERSADGASFYEIGSVKAAGNSTFTVDYTFTDATPLQGMNYYRLKQVDKDGNFEYSEIRSVNFNNANGAITISPNPAKDKISVTINGNTKPVKIYLVSNSGQQLQAYDMTGQYMQLNLPNLAAGVYYIRIEGEGISSKNKLVIQ